MTKVRRSAAADTPMTSPRPTVEIIGVSAASRQLVTYFASRSLHGTGVDPGWSTLVTVGCGAGVDHPGLTPD